MGKKNLPEPPVHTRLQFRVPPRRSKPELHIIDSYSTRITGRRGLLSRWIIGTGSMPKRRHLKIEVDRFGDLEEELKVQGYSSIWKMQTGNAIDGCAVFWRTSRFKLVYEECIEFNKHGLWDNVAQICVLELIRQDNPADTSTLSTSSTSFNKVLICNIHVLCNPKRGEIKLGQVRMLLQRAHAVSKTWNDTPVVLCGDFNCTPKLDFTGIDRDKVSGQSSTEIFTSRPYNSGRNPYASPGTQSSGNSVQVSLMVDSKQSDSLPVMQKNDQESLENVPSVNDHSRPQYTRIVQDALDVSLGSALCIEETRNSAESSRTKFNNISW